MRILVFSAHSADFCSRAGGTIALHARQGATVRVHALTYGERSESGGLYAGGAHPPLEDVKAIRRQEAEAAAATLGAEIVFHDWGDLLFEYSQARVVTLAQEIRAFGPQVILTHHGPDPCSVDHDTTSRLVTRAVQVAGAPGLETEAPPGKGAAVFFFEATIPLTELEGFSPDFYVNISADWPTKLRALQCFSRAQGVLSGWYADVARQRAFQARRASGRADIEYAEAFERTMPWVGDRLPVADVVGD